MSDPIGLVTISTDLADMDWVLLVGIVLAAVLAGCWWAAALLAQTRTRRWASLAGALGFLALGGGLIVTAISHEEQYQSSAQGAFEEATGTVVAADGRGFDWRFEGPQALTVTVDGARKVCVLEQVDQRDGEIAVAVTCVPAAGGVGGR